MSYLTLEVQIDHGRLVAKEPQKLPEKADGLLTILPLDSHIHNYRTPLEALEALQKHLGMDSEKAANWMAGVREARR